MVVEEIYRADKEAALDTLCEAFYDYPVMRSSLADTGDAYGSQLRAMIDLFCENRLYRNQPLHVIRDGQVCLGVAVCSGTERIPQPPELSALERQVNEMMGEAAVARLRAYDVLCEAWEPDFPTHYLGMIGVRNDQQGQGIGKLLVEHLKDVVRADEASGGLCLNTETAKNVPIYERLGFTVQAEAQNEDLHTWCMFWKCE
jgi:GNAT superfamily N-acetyltransferase